jgi:hypothetical protein
MPDRVLVRRRRSVRRDRRYRRGECADHPSSRHRRPVGSGVRRPSNGACGVGADAQSQDLPESAYQCGQEPLGPRCERVHPQRMRVDAVLRDRQVAPPPARAWRGAVCATCCAHHYVTGDGAVVSRLIRAWRATEACHVGCVYTSVQLRHVSSEPHGHRLLPDVEAPTTQRQFLRKAHLGAQRSRWLRAAGQR